MIARRLAFAVLVLTSGCDLYFGGGDDEPCTDLGGVAPVPPAQLLRDPNTDQCVATGGGGGGGCDSCGNCWKEDVATAPDWAYCYSECEQLDEQTCLGTSGCYAAYQRAYMPYEDGLEFSGCRATAPSGPVQGSCSNLPATECSRHDDCALVYTPPFNGSAVFEACVDEPAPTYGCEAVDCGPGYHCETQCHPCDGKDGPCDTPWCEPACVPDGPQNTCATVDCGAGYACVEVCDGATPIMEGGCIPAQCYPTCVPTGGGDPGSCFGDVVCATLPPACPTGTTAGRANGCWTGYCIPNSACGPNDPGTCLQPGELTCPMAPPACPLGTTPGVSNHCWTGFCIPDGNCAVPACELVGDAATCNARPDCVPVYEGSDCICDPSGCTCQVHTFDHCQTLVSVPTPEPTPL